MQSKEEIQNFLDQCHGSDGPYIRSALFGGLVFTQAVGHFREIAECYWLVDAIASYRRTDEFQVWKLWVNDDKSAVLTMEDGNGNEEIRQKIAHTTFPLREVTFWAEIGGYGTCAEDWTQCLVLMFPSER